MSQIQEKPKIESVWKVPDWKTVTQTLLEVFSKVEDLPCRESDSRKLLTEKREQVFGQR